ncbi:MAG: 5-formyltetrahydrofolate cyclo-ligase [Planctomycetota bacterium]|jgi:5-formyltetrahydrofolate cyclo-ligase
MVHTTTDHKEAVRSELRQRLKAMNPKAIHEQSQRAASQLAATKEFQRARALMIFLPLEHEIDACPIALRAWQAGKTVTSPLVNHNQKRMLPVELCSLDEPMDVDRYGVRTPRTGEVFPIEMIDLVIAPGLGFDRAGHRIGRGGGYYDRFLSHRDFNGVVCGLALSEQVVEAVPTDDHDARLNMLVTDREVLRFNHRR